MQNGEKYFWRPISFLCFSNFKEISTCTIHSLDFSQRVRKIWKWRCMKLIRLLQKWFNPVAIVASNFAEKTIAYLSPIDNLHAKLCTLLQNTLFAKSGFPQFYCIPIPEKRRYFFRDYYCKKLITKFKVTTGSPEMICLFKFDSDRQKYAS